MLTFPSFTPIPLRVRYIYVCTLNKSILLVFIISNEISTTLSYSTRGVYEKTHVSFNQYKTCSATRTQPYTETKAACNGVDVWMINHMPLLILVLVQILSCLRVSEYDQSSLLLTPCLTCYELL